MNKLGDITLIQNYRKIRCVNRALSSLKPLMARLYDDRAVLRPVGLTTRPHTDLYLNGDFILMCFGNTVKTKENQFLSFSRKIRLGWKKFLYHQFPNMMIRTHAKFAPPDFINKKNEWEAQVF